MKASIFLAATGAALAMAGPINKRAMETDWVYEVVTVTVTAGNEPGGVFAEHPRTKKPTFTARPPKPSIVVPAPQPEPEPTQPPPPPRPPVQAPKPSTKKTKSPKPTKKPEPEPEPSPEPEPEEPEEPEEPQQPGLDSYAKTMLEQHNIHRANHSAPALTWDSTLAQYAKNTAESCRFEHDMDQGSIKYGQNLASWGAPGDISAAKMDTAASGVTDQWYNGEFAAWTYYEQDDPDEGADLTEWGHFTQVLWKSSEKVGCYTGKCPAGSVLSYPSWFTICNYDPPGNYEGEYGDNVLPPLGEKTVTI